MSDAGNVADGLLRRLLPLQTSRLIKAAHRATGLEDFGPPSIEEPLAVLLESLNREASLSALGHIVAWNDIKHLLSTRLRMQADRARLPAIEQERIERPIVITGLPRTGTTLLHGLLNEDPDHRAPLTWEVMHPSPPPRPPGEPDSGARIKRATRQLRWIDRLSPGFQAIHEVGAELPQEDIAIIAYAFTSLRFPVTYHLPRYLDYLRQADMRPAYQYHYRFLQHLQFGRPANRWVLKAPSHLPCLDAVLDAYPDAVVVQTHRDPMESIPSLVSLRVALRSAFARAADPVTISEEIAAFWSEALERAARVRQETDSTQFQDVQYDDLLRDPIATVRRLYRDCQLELSPQVESRMRNFLERNPQGKHGEHQYRGIDTLNFDKIGAQFNRYRREMGWTDSSKRFPTTQAEDQLKSGSGY